MGGRGGSAGFDNDGPNPGGGGNGSWDRTGLMAEFQRPKETIQDAIGTKGRAHSIGDALEYSNPFFDGVHDEYASNCQRCVVAYELRRRGYNVMALPTFENDKMPYSIHGNGYWMGAFRNARPESVGASTKAQALSNLHNKILSYGNGARAVVRIQSDTRSGNGHVFIAENQNGRVVYVDPQTNTIYSPKNVLNHARSSTVQVLRTDNLKVSYRVKEMVTQSIKGVKNQGRR